MVLGLIALGVRLIPVQSVIAQSTGLSLGIGQSIKVSGVSTVANGSIISFQNNQYQLSAESYDKSMFGVSATNPAIEVTDNTTRNEPGVTSVLRSGQVQVRVNGRNGAIIKGDRITSSDQPGVGMKAVKSGFVLGVAEGSFSPSSETDEGLIPVTLDIKFTFAEDTPGSERIAARLKDVVSLSTVSIAEDPLQTLRYVVAGVVVIGAFTFAFFTFGRLAHNGIEALGRNPLASRPIVAAMFFNILVALGIMLTGLVAAYLIVTW